MATCLMVAHVWGKVAIERRPLDLSPEANSRRVNLVQTAPHLHVMV